MIYKYCFQNRNRMSSLSLNFSLHLIINLCRVFVERKTILILLGSLIDVELLHFFAHLLKRKLIGLLGNPFQNRNSTKTTYFGFDNLLDRENGLSEHSLGILHFNEAVIIFT